MSVRKYVYPVVILAIFASCHILFAGTTGKIIGQLSDEKTGEPLIGANVILEGTTIGAATDNDGNYTILRVPPGIYIVSARMIGYGDVRMRNVQVSIDKTTKLDFKLGEIVLTGETVTITAQKPIVQIDLTSTEAVVNSDAIRLLPLDNVDAVVNLQAGVVDGHVRGGRIGEVMYMVNGIRVNDVYSGEKAFEVENNSVAELQVISGTFNAEYGQAMSGVVNIVTKEGGNQYNGELSAYVGDYVSNHSDLFYNIDKLNPIYNMQASLSGPVPHTKKLLKFFTSGRLYDSEGYLYGRKVFTPTDHSDFSRDNPVDWIVQARGKTYKFSENLARNLIDRAEAVPMNPNRRFTWQNKLSYNITANDNINYELFIQRNDYQDYNHEFLLNPDGNYLRKRNGYNHRFTWTHVVNPSTFFEVRFSHFFTRYRQFVLEDPFDPNFPSTDRLQDTGANAFLSGGMQMWHFKRSTRTALGKLDFTSQITRTHQIKTGIEFTRHRLWLHEYQVVPELPSRIPPLTTMANNEYTRNPEEISAYIQDKMEYQDVIVNTGFRLDYFRPDGGIPLDFSKPGESLQKKAESSMQWSPRLGIAYPITDRGVIHISYGHFFQVPNFDFLFANPEFDILPLQSIPSPPPHSQLNTIGNADLKPQKTVIYEIGLQQQLANNLGLVVTAFYKDIRNLLGTEVHQTLQGIKYGRYINRDYGNVKGVTLALDQRPVSGVSATLDYTFQIARGNASDPNSAFLDQSTDPPMQTEKKMVALDWDRRHQINLTLALGNRDSYNISIIGRYGTGLPYTPTFQNIQTAVENSARRPSILNVDLYAFKMLPFKNFHFSVFLRVYNLIDRKNENDVFSDTGRAGYTLAPLYTGGLRPRGLNTLSSYFIRPDFYSAPRELNIGFSLEF